MQLARQYQAALYHRFMSIGSRIRKARKMLGWTQETAGYRIGVSTQAVSQWERGEVSPSLDRILNIADALGVTVQYLTQRDDSPEDMQSGPQYKKSNHTKLIRAPFVHDLPDEWFDGQVMNIQKLAQPGIEVSTEILGDAFAVRIENEQMSPVFRPNDIVIFDTGIAPIRGDFVFLLLDGEWDFLQYRGMIDGDNARRAALFVPLNPDFSHTQIEIDQTNRIVATAVERRRSRKSEDWRGNLSG